MNLKHLPALIILFFSSLWPVAAFCQEQSRNTDSLRRQLVAASSDTTKVRLLVAIATSMKCTDADSQLSNLTRARQVAERTGWQPGLAMANKGLGYLYFSCLRQYHEALTYFTDNITIARNQGDKAGEALNMEYTAKCYEKLGMHEKALTLYQKILDLKPGYDMEMGVLGDMGFTYNSIGDYARSLSCYISSLQLLDNTIKQKKKSDIQDTLQRAGLFLNIGDIYQYMQQPDKAYENYHNALIISHQTHDRNFGIWSQLGIGETYLLKKRYNDAIATYRKALDDCAGMDNFMDQARIHNQLAKVHIEMQESDVALGYAQKALKLAEDNAYNDLIPKIYNTLGAIYQAKKDYTKAVSYSQKALTVYQANHELDNEKDTWSALSTTYEQMGQPLAALGAYRNYIKIRDSVHNIEKTNELTRIDLEYSFAKKQLADSLKQAAVYSKKIERQRVITYTSLTGIVMLLLLAFFMYRSYQIQKKYNALLSRDQKRHLEHIEAQSNVLTDIAHTQSHEIRGPVATILGLAQLYNFENMNDPVNREVMEGITTMTEQLDTVVKEVIIKENKLRKQKTI